MTSVLKIFFGYASSGKGNKSTNKQDYIQLKKLLHSEVNYQQNKKAADAMGEDICKQHDPQGINIQNIQRTYTTQRQKINKQTTQLKTGYKGLPWWRSGWESACRCRGHRFKPWSGRIPHATEQLGPCATTTELAPLEPVLRNERLR